MSGITGDIAASTPSWWRQTGPMGEADAKIDVNAASPEDGENGESFGFADFIDIINPLQHIPVVSTAYRELTGDQIGATARNLGGALYGGPFGLVAAIASTISEAETGRDIGANALAMLSGGGASGEADPSSPKAMAPSTPPITTQADPRQITLQFNQNPASPEPAISGKAGGSPLGPPPQWPARSAGPAATPPAAGAISGTPTLAQAQSPAPEHSAQPPANTEAAIAAATATRVPRQELPSFSERAFEKLMRRAGAEKATSIDTAATAALSPANTTRRDLATPEGKESVQDWMIRALEKYEQMKNPSAVAAINAGKGAS